MPSTILRADNSASIGGVNHSPLSQQQTEQVFHYKYELNLSMIVQEVIQSESSIWLYISTNLFYFFTDI